MPRPAAHAARLCGVLLVSSLWSPALAHARADELTGLINAYRAAPSACAGRPAAPVAALVPADALARVRIGRGTFLESALEQLGYRAEHVEAISVTGPPDAASAMDTLRQKYCDRLLSTDFSAIGTARNGASWQVVLARPLVFPTLPGWEQAGQELVALVNAARARPRQCGTQAFGAAPPLAWNPVLGQAALAHSSDMAARRYFSHKAPDGSMPADRASRVGYRWSRIGENIASGQRSAGEALNSWLDSPGHCANIMNPGYAEMGAAYAIDPGNRNQTPLWTQVFGTAR